MREIKTGDLKVIAHRNISLLEKLLEKEPSPKVFLAKDECGNEYLVLEFSSGKLAFFSDGEYGDVPLCFIAKKIERE